jgi:predicted Rossmann-fold nucleotide-binding protein
MAATHDHRTPFEDSGASLLPRARRIGVIGGSRIEDTAQLFCCKLGEKLAENANVIVVTGGTKG